LSSNLKLTLPGELYTPYEKLYLPFDFTTWVMLMSIFTLAFVIIFFINLMPRWIQDVFYGVGIRMPAFNVVGTFFGIGQTRLPEGNFPRMLLLLFIWFCLIFRTAYQSIMFEYMTSNPRRPAPGDVEEAFNKYDVLFVSRFDYLQSKVFKVNKDGFTRL
jgi:hypothetical protein